MHSIWPENWTRRVLQQGQGSIAQPVTEFLNIRGTARASIGIHNTKEEVDTLNALEKTGKLFGS
jgi:selenocysteine lyase/cysteine desulfurase